MPESNFSARVREARNRLHMSQDALAKAAGLNQPAISSLERGHRNAVSHEGLVRLAGILGISLAEAAFPSVDTAAPAVDVLFYCLNFDCPASTVLVNSGRLQVRPAMFWCPAELESIHCKHCGGGLSKVCQNCSSPFVKGAAFCMICGGALVTVHPEVAQAADLIGLAARLNERQKLYFASEQEPEKLPALVVSNHQRRTGPNVPANDA